jgi:hypothetical protein
MPIICLLLNLWVVVCCILALIFLDDGETLRPVVLLCCGALLAWISLQEHLDRHH